MPASPLRPAAMAFDAIAPMFDARFSDWRSVAAQRRVVRHALLQTLPKNGRVLELGGGTGQDALWLAQNGFCVTLTDVSPAMLEAGTADRHRRLRAAQRSRAMDFLPSCISGHSKCLIG